MLQPTLRRECSLWKRLLQPLIAPDRRLGESAPASLATLVIDPASGQRTAWLAEVPPVLMERWSVKDQYIAHVEQAAAIMVGISHSA